MTKNMTQILLNIWFSHSSRSAFNILATLLIYTLLLYYDFNYNHNDFKSDCVIWYHWVYQIFFLIQELLSWPILALLHILLILLLLHYCFSIPFCKLS